MTTIFERTRAFIQSQKDTQPDACSKHTSSFSIALRGIDVPTLQFIASVVHSMDTRVNASAMVQQWVNAQRTGNGQGVIQFNHPFESFPAKSMELALARMHQSLQQQLTVGNDGALIFHPSPDEPFSMDYLLRAALPVRVALQMPGEVSTFTDPLTLYYQLPEGKFQKSDGSFVSGVVDYATTNDIRQHARDTGNYAVDAEVAGACFVSARIEADHAAAVMEKLGLTTPGRGLAA